MSFPRALPPGFIAPCLPTKAPQPLPARSGYTRSSTTASGSSRVRNGERVKLYSRPGNDLTYRFPLIIGALAPLTGVTKSLAPREWIRTTDRTGNNRLLFR
jgi:hypothetical protein